MARRSKVVGPRLKKSDKKLDEGEYRWKKAYRLFLNKASKQKWDVAIVFLKNCIWLILDFVLILALHLKHY